MSNESLLLVEDASLFSPISQLHYQYYKNADEIRESLNKNEAVQCVVSKEDVPFGEAQCPDVCDYADGVDTVQFLLTLKKKPEVRRS
jgi:hypothetical protein